MFCSVLFTFCFGLFTCRFMLFCVVYVMLCHDSEEEDEIVECDGCGVTVHEGMYSHTRGGSKDMAVRRWIQGRG